MRRLLAVMALALAACAPAADVATADGATADGATADGATADGATAGRSATARLGQAARLGDVTVRPLAVLEDSRCPRDATCIWAGRLRLRARVTGVRGEAELVLGRPFALPRGGTLTLTAALPERRHNPPSGPAARFTFRRD